jgi:hypothetical protein
MWKLHFAGGKCTFRVDVRFEITLVIADLFFAFLEEEGVITPLPPPPDPRLPGGKVFSASQIEANTKQQASQLSLQMKICIFNQDIIRKNP